MKAIGNNNILKSIYNSGNENSELEQDLQSDIIEVKNEKSVDQLNQIIDDSQQKPIETPKEKQDSGVKNSEKKNSEKKNSKISTNKILLIVMLVLLIPVLIYFIFFKEKRNKEEYSLETEEI